VTGATAHGKMLAATSANMPPIGWDRVKVSETLGATTVALVGPMVTSLVGITGT
jgi:hypothetical protein